MKLIIFGKQGSGKGTQAQIISKDLSIPHISTGDIFRDNMAKGTELGKKAREFINQGKLVPDEITVGMVKDALTGVNGFILDGFPRNISQAKVLDKFTAIDLVLNLEINDEEAIRRIAGRRTCPKCNQVYHVSSNPPKKEGICDSCKTNLIQREDDTEDAIKKRLEIYQKDTAPILNFYRKKGILKDIEGERPIDVIWKEINGITSRH